MVIQRSSGAWIYDVQIIDWPFAEVARILTQIDCDFMVPN